MPLALIYKFYKISKLYFFVCILLGGTYHAHLLSISHPLAGIRNALSEGSAQFSVRVFSSVLLQFVRQLFGSSAGHIS